MRHLGVIMFKGKDVRRFSFTFPKNTMRRKTWTIFCKRKDFVPTKNRRLCSDHFTRDEIQRNPAQLEQYGYNGAMIGLKPDAVPDVLLLIKSEMKMWFCHPDSMKRQKADVSYQLVSENYIYLLYHVAIYGNCPVI